MGEPRTSTGPRSPRRPYAVLVAVVMSLVFLVASACSGTSDSGDSSSDDGPDAASATTIEPDQPPPAPPTCSPARPPSAETSVMTITSGGQTRQFLLSVPPGWDGATGAPLILDFHDAGFTSAQHAAYTLLPAKGSAVGSVVATLQASSSGWQLGADGVVDDFAFTHDVVSQLESQLCIDPARLYAVGYGTGGWFASLLACESEDPIAAIGLVAGVLGPACEDGPPVSVIVFHGTADAILPYGGSEVAGEGTTPAGALPGAEQAMTNWATHNGCVTSPTTAEVGHARQLSWLGCTGGAAVTLYAVEGGGHTWPGGTKLADSVAGALGPVSTELAATNVMLAFFASHPGPPA